MRVLNTHRFKILYYRINKKEDLNLKKKQKSLQLNENVFHLKYSELSELNFRSF